MGGLQLYDGDDYVMSLKTPKQVADVEAALKSINEAAFRDGFAEIDVSDLEHSREDDLAYAWDWFLGLKAFWTKAALDERYVLFTVDQ